MKTKFKTIIGDDINVTGGRTIKTPSFVIPKTKPKPKEDKPKKE